MQTEDSFTNERPFDPEAARAASLRDTISRVRFCRRARRAAQAGVVLLVVSLTVWLALPGAVPLQRTKPEVADADGLRVKTVPLRVEQRVVTVKDEGMYVRTPEREAVVMCVSTPADAVVPRLRENEFRAWLAQHELSVIQLDGGMPEVWPVRNE